MSIYLMQAIILLSFLPPICLYFREKNSKDTVFWLLTCITVFISAFHAYTNHHNGWDQSFSSSLWLTITSCLVIFSIVCLITDHAHRLSFLLYPYLFIVGVFAIIWTDVKYPTLVIDFNQTWLAIHILVSLATYALVTLAAFAALASMLQERCIKGKKRNHLSFKLPSIASSEQLFVRLLLISEIVLLIGLMTGISINYISKGYLFSFEHKPVFGLAVFLTIGAVLFLHYTAGLRGKLAMKYILLVYLLLTLSYPGVKFVTDVILAN